MFEKSILSIIFIFLSLNSAHSAPSEASSDKNTAVKSSVQKETKKSLFQEGKEHADNMNFRAALKVFEKANAKYRNDPDLLNMLAYCQRKTGKIDEAIINYKKALKLKPQFPEAREYLGEAYIQAALKEIETLKSYGPKASDKLADVIKEFKEAAAQL